jgi:hypothetical protein
MCDLKIFPGCNTPDPAIEVGIEGGNRGGKGREGRTRKKREGVIGEKWKESEGEEK